MYHVHGSYYSAKFIFPDFFLTFQDKMNHFPWLICSCEIQRQFSIACNRTRNKGGATNLKVEAHIKCKRSKQENFLTVIYNSSNFFCIFVNFCTLIFLNSLIFSDFPWPQEPWCRLHSPVIIISPQNAATLSVFALPQYHFNLTSIHLYCKIYLKMHIKQL